MIEHNEHKTGNAHKISEHEEKKEHHSEHKKEDKPESKFDAHEHRPEHIPKAVKPKNQQLWMAISGILGLLLIISIFTSGFGRGNCEITGMLTSEQAGDKALNFINANILQGQGEAVLESVEEEAQLYKISLDIAGTKYNSHVTKDGKLLFPSGIDMNAVEESKQEQTQEQQPPVADTSLKKEKTEVDLFVMSYCPFGTQAQRALLPVMKMLGDKADINIRFVNYIMHDKKEIDENTVQYCIQKDQNEKMVDYLECFLNSMNSGACIDQAGVDKEKLNSCISEADKEFNIEANYDNKQSWLNGRYPIYEVDNELNAKYSVRGSPHLVINGKTYSGARTPEAFKKAICEGFEQPPEECGDVLPTTEEATDGNCS